MINITKIKAEVCETCGAHPVDEHAQVRLGIRYEARRFECGRQLQWAEAGRAAWSSPCPKDPLEVARRAARIDAVKKALAVIRDSVLNEDDQRFFEERIKGTWFDIKEHELR